MQYVDLDKAVEAAGYDLNNLPEPGTDMALDALICELIMEGDEQYI